MNFVWLSADYCLKNTAYFDKKRANKRQTFCDISIENKGKGKSEICKITQVLRL